MELKDFFHQQHNLQNVEVLGLPTKSEDTLSSLLKEVTTRSQGSSFMVDELVLPGDYDKETMKRLHEQVTKELEQLQNHFEAQPAKPPLWIACAEIDWGEAEHFERSYLTSILPPAFHLPEMDVPLRNTKQTLALAGLEGNKGVKELGYYNSIQTNPVYKVPENLMEGLEGKEFLVNNWNDEEELERVVEEATKEVLRRTGGAGFPLLCYHYASTLSAYKRGVERAGATALVYHNLLPKESCSEVEVEEWISKRRSGEEERVLVADHEVSRGWECSHALVVDLRGFGGLENLVMRTVGYCALVKQRKN